MKKVFDFGRINLTGTGKRYPVSVSVELRRRGGEDVFRMVHGKREYTGEKTPVYVEFSACAEIGACWGGQCLDEIEKHKKDFTPERRELWEELYTYWKKYHLNGMHAGTPEQEKAVKTWMEETGNRYDYKAACEMLKSCGLYEVPFTGKSIGKYYNGELYKYGHGWIIQEIEGPDLIKIEHILST